MNDEKIVFIRINLYTTYTEAVKKAMFMVVSNQIVTVIHFCHSHVVILIHGK